MRFEDDFRRTEVYRWFADGVLGVRGDKRRQTGSKLGRCLQRIRIAGSEKERETTEQPAKVIRSDGSCSSESLSKSVCRWSSIAHNSSVALNTRAIGVEAGLVGIDGIDASR